MQLEGEGGTIKKKVSGFFSPPFLQIWLETRTNNYAKFSFLLIKYKYSPFYLSSVHSYLQNNTSFCCSQTAFFLFSCVGSGSHHLGWHGIFGVAWCSAFNFFAGSKFSIVPYMLFNLKIILTLSCLNVFP